MVEALPTMRTAPNIDEWSYQDKLFNNDINRCIVSAEKQYDNMMYREALRAGFYDLQVLFELTLRVVLSDLFHRPHVIVIGK